MQSFLQPPEERLDMGIGCTRLATLAHDFSTAGVANGFIDV
jgi:hypothetical protein